MKMHQFMGAAPVPGRLGSAATAPATAPGGASAPPPPAHRRPPAGFQSPPPPPAHHRRRQGATTHTRCRLSGTTYHHCAQGAAAGSAALPPATPGNHHRRQSVTTGSRCDQCIITHHHRPQGAAHARAHALSGVQHNRDKATKQTTSHRTGGVRHACTRTTPSTDRNRRCAEVRGTALALMFPLRSYPSRARPTHCAPALPSPPPPAASSASSTDDSSPSSRATWPRSGSAPSTRRSPLCAFTSRWRAPSTRGSSCTHTSWMPSPTPPRAKRRPAATSSMTRTKEVTSATCPMEQLTVLKSPTFTGWSTRPPAPRRKSSASTAQTTAGNPRTGEE